MNDQNITSDENKYICTELNNNRRHYSSLRFAMLSIYFAVFGGLASVSFGFVEIKSSSIIDSSFWAKWSGLLFTFVFFWVEILCELNLRHIYRVANKELSPKYQSLVRRKGHRALKAYFGTWGLYIVLIIFWIIVIVRSIGYRS